MASQKAQFDSLKETLVKSNCNNHSVSQVDNIIEGMGSNLNIMEGHSNSILNYLKKNTKTLDDIDWLFFMNPGRPYHYMLRYFYQDWYGTKDFMKVTDLFTKTILKYCNDTESVAVLRCWGVVLAVFYVIYLKYFQCRMV